MNGIGRKLVSRKLWSALAGLAAGLAMAFGLDEGIVSSVAGAVVAIVSVVTYIVTEGRIDTAALEQTAQSAQNAAKQIGGSDENQ